MVRTHELFAAAFAFGDHSAAMAANGRHHVDLAVLVARDDQRIAEHRDRVEIAGIRHLVDAADAEPLAVRTAEHGFHLARVPFGRDVAPAGQRRRLLERAAAGGVGFRRKEIDSHR